MVPTHHHLDHAGGIRAFMASGATVVAPFSAKGSTAASPKRRTRANRTVWRKTSVASSSKSFGGGPRILTDGSRRVEVYPMPTSHAEDLVVVYLPAEKDTDRSGPYQPAQRPSARRAIGQRIRHGARQTQPRRSTIVGIHGDSATLQAAREAAQKASRQ